MEFIIDEAPDGIIISSFDPFRREMARLALEKLVKDGRIQPAKIEESVETAKADLVKRTQEIGESAAQDLGVFRSSERVASDDRPPALPDELWPECARALGGNGVHRGNDGARARA